MTRIMQRVQLCRVLMGVLLVLAQLPQSEVI